MSMHFRFHTLLLPAVTVLRQGRPLSLSLEVSKPVSIGHRLFQSRYSVLKLQPRRQIIRVSVTLGLARTVTRKFHCSASRLLVKSEASTTSAIMPEKVTFQRLIKSVIPTSYDLLLKPDLKAFVFDGKVTISVEVVTSVHEIVLHCLDLTLKTVEYRTSEGNALKPTETKLSIDNETLTIVFSTPLAVGKGKLYIEFSGEINDKMKGFYRSKYTSVDGEERYAAVTQFEATDARRCFPCWDEPAIKAVFNITLIVPENKVALSNMPVSSESHADSLRTVTFLPTPVMSTYLVACVVGEYDHLEARSTDGVDVRVYTPVGKREQGRFALEVATKVLPYYKDYFNIAYPLPKIDLIAIADFSAGAMENWGLVTYRETCLLVDSENTSAVRKQWIALVVGHELAHQWFGNLVTMEWWTHLWLNEGYASFVEFLCVEHLFPEYAIWTQFVTDTYCRALELDCLKNSHPIEVAVGHPSEIDEIFDDISYNKGASVIRMLHKYIGDSDFRKGMNLYLTRHQYSNTFTEDLWAALEEASGKPVAQVMTTWTKQMGFPVVKVSRQNSTLTLSQSKFCADGATDVDCRWMIPIMLSTSQRPNEVVHSTVLSAASASIDLDNVTPDQWVKVNPGTVGYYRTQYPPEMLAQFVPSIRDKSLPPLDRLGLLDDLFALVQAGQSPTVEVLKLMQAFTAEDNYTVWSSINNCLGKLSVLLSHTELEHEFRAYVRALMADVHARLGWEPTQTESHLDVLLRSLVIGRLVSCDHTATLQEAKRRFADHVSGTAAVSADLRSAVYKAALSSGDADSFNTMLKLYREADLHEEKDRISRALGAIRDEALLKQVLQFAISDEVRSQDSVFVVISVAMNSKGRQLAWDFFKDNWKQLMERYDGGFLLSRLVKYTTENFASEEKALEIEAFFSTHPSPGTERTVQQSLETIRLNAAWLARDYSAVKTFLADRQV